MSEERKAKWRFVVKVVGAAAGVSVVLVLEVGHIAADQAAQVALDLLVSRLCGW